MHVSSLILQTHTSIPGTSSGCRHTYPSGPGSGRTLRLSKAAPPPSPPRHGIPPSPQHRDARYRDYLSEGISAGFWVGFARSQPLLSAAANMPSAAAHPEVVSAFISSELERNRILGPLHLSLAGVMQCNRLGVVPKGHTLGKWRIITDLSFPAGRSVNDGIDPALCSLSYVSVDTVVSMVTALGPGSRLTKVDIEAAYRLVPVIPMTVHSSVSGGKGNCTATQCCLSVWSAAKIFNALADALEWIIRSRGVSHVAHYLDDFVVVGAPGSPQCADDLRTLESTCRELGVLLAVAKCVAPTTQLTFLGIEVLGRVHSLAARQTFADTGVAVRLGRQEDLS